MPLDEIRYVLFGVGTLAFFAAVYLSVTHPELVEHPAAEPVPQEEVQQSPWRRWDRIITWTMWISWGLVGVLTFADEAGLLEFLKV